MQELIVVNAGTKSGKKLLQKIIMSSNHIIPYTIDDCDVYRNRYKCDFAGFQS